MEKWAMGIVRPKLIFTGFWLAVWLGSALNAGAQDCEYDYDVVQPCILRGGTYQIRVPEFEDPHYRPPVVVLLHDAGGSGRATISNERLTEAFVTRGYAVIAPDALPRRNLRFRYTGPRTVLGREVVSANRTENRNISDRRFVMKGIQGKLRNLKFGKDTGWYFYNTDQLIFPGFPDEIVRLGRDEIAFLRTVLRSAAFENWIDPQPALVIGLGHGGSLVWQIACHAPNFAKLLAPVDGAFWRNVPKNCKTGAHLIHTHHRASKFWPLEGAQGSPRRFERTSIYRNLNMLLRVNRCGSDKTEHRNKDLGLSRTTWANCAAGGPVEFMRLDEPFAFQAWWIEEMLGRIVPSGDELPPEALEEPSDTGPLFKKPGAGLGPRFKRAR